MHTEEVKDRWPSGDFDLSRSRRKSRSRSRRRSRSRSRGKGKDRKERGKDGEKKKKDKKRSVSRSPSPPTLQREEPAVTHSDDEESPAKLDPRCFAHLHPSLGSVTLTLPLTLNFVLALLPLLCSCSFIHVWYTTSGLHSCHGSPTYCVALSMSLTLCQSSGQPYLVLHLVRVWHITSGLYKSSGQPYVVLSFVHVWHTASGLHSCHCSPTCCVALSKSDTLHQDCIVVTAALPAA